MTPIVNGGELVISSCKHLQRIGGPAREVALA